MCALTFLALTLGSAPGQPPPITPPAQPNPAAIPKLGEKREFPKSIEGRDLTSWVKDLSDRDPAVREIAIKVLPAFGPDAIAPASRGLIARANDPDSGVCVNAIITLGAIGARDREQAKPIVDALKLAINNSRVGSIVRLHATRALANYGVLANDATATLIGIAKDSSWETRRTVAMALGRIGLVQSLLPSPTAKPTDPKPTASKPMDDDKARWVPSDKVLAALKAMMNDDDCAQVRLEAVQSLVLLGPPDVLPEQYITAVTPLYEAVATRLKNEKDKGVLVWLIMLQMRLNGADLTDENIRKVMTYISDVTVGARVHALTAVGLMGEKARPAVPAMIQALQAPEGIVVAAAITSLAALGNLSSTALPELTKLRDSKDKEEVLKALAGEAVEIISGRKKK